MSNDTAVLATFTSRHMGRVAQGYLADAGVPADLRSDDAADTASTPDVIRPARLVVPTRYVGRAREILNRAYARSLQPAQGSRSAR